MIILGLTGSIGMGKSTAAKMLQRMGASVCDSDAIVHRLLRRGGAAVAAVEKAFPGVTDRGAVDRRRLGARVFGNAEALRRLEAILHPMVRREQESFLRAASRRRVEVAVLDIPLLFETGAERRVDWTIVVSAPYRIQRARVLSRSGMTEEKFESILKNQMPDGEKRRRADYVVSTGLTKNCAHQRLKRVIGKIKNRKKRLRPLRTAVLERGTNA